MVIGERTSQAGTLVIVFCAECLMYEREGAGGCGMRHALKIDGSLPVDDYELSRD